MKRFMIQSLLVLAGGGLGSLSRLFTTQALASHFIPSFPTAILVVNFSGCLIAGILFGLLNKNGSDFLKAFLLMGFLGSFTTYADFNYDTNNFIVQDQLGLALLNIALTYLGGFFLFTLGNYFTKNHIKKH